MKANEIVTTWKNAEQNDGAINNIAGAPVINEQLLAQVQGGMDDGWVHTVSAECFGGIRCDFWNW